MGAFDDLIEQAKQDKGGDQPKAGDQSVLRVPHSATGAFDDLIADAMKKKAAAEAPTTSVGEAVGRGAVSGATFNFPDELAGIMAAGGARPDQVSSKGAALGQLVTGLAKYWGGSPDAAKAYDTTAQRERARNALVEKEHPVAYNTAAIGGSMMVPGIGEAEGLGLGMRALRSGATGAAFGAASGLGEGEDIQDRLRHAAYGGGLGFGVGGVFSPLSNLALTGGQAAYRKVFGAVNPENTALRQVASANARDVRSDPVNPSTGLPGNRLTPAEMAATPEATVLDLGGNATRNLARNAANVSPEASAALNRTVSDRFSNRGSRITNWFNENFHYPNPEETQKALDDIEKTVNNKNYRTAFSAGDRPIMTDDIQHMVDNAPAMVDAIKAAIPEVKNRAVAMGMGARNPGIRFEDGVPVFDRGAPNLQFWDTVKRQLDGRATTAFRNGDANASSYAGLAQKLRDELDSQVGEYAPARQGAAKFFGAENALDAGKKFLTNDMTAEQGRQALARFSPLEKQLFQDSFAKSYMDKIGAVANPTGVLNEIAGAPKALEKLNVALGPQKAAELETKLRAENIMNRGRGAITGGSNTTAQLIAAGIIGGGAGYELGDVQGATAGGLLTAALTHGARIGNIKVNQQVMQHVGEMLTSRDPAVVERGHALIARSEKMMNVLRHADTAVAKATGAEGGSNLPPSDQPTQ